MLGTPPPPPPPNVPELKEAHEGEAPKTLRERLTQHRQNPACASCHNRIDPIGFGLENYDVLGRWRTEDAGKPIDAKGELPDGTTFEGPEQLKAALLGQEGSVHPPLTNKMLGYALGRGLTLEDSCTVDRIVAEVAKNDYKAHTLIQGIVLSVPFRYQAGTNRRRARGRRSKRRAAVSTSFRFPAERCCAAPASRSACRGSKRWRRLRAQLRASASRRCAWPCSICRTACIPDMWTPEGEGRDFKLSPTLEPLSDLKSEIVVPTNLWNQASKGGEGHYVKVSGFLTCTTITKTQGVDLNCNGVSMDQIAAQRAGSRTPLPSLELGISPVSTGVDTNVGYTRVYGAHVAWSGPTTPLAREINPHVRVRAAFPREQSPARFRQARQAAARLAFSTTPSNCAAGRRRRTGSGSTSIFRSFARSKTGSNAPAVPSGASGSRARRSIRRRSRTGFRRPTPSTSALMFDLIALAFQTDTTRICTFMFGNEVANTSFAFLDGVKGGHHDTSHHQKDPEKLRQYQFINRWHVEQYAYLLRKLRDMKEGESFRARQFHDPVRLRDPRRRRAQSA